MRHPYRKKVIYCGLIVITFVILLHPDMNGRGTYDFIAKEDILNNLHEETAENFTSSAIIDCEYYDIINDETTLSPGLVDGDLIEGHGIREGGEYSPQECKPKFSTAIIVPYRDRAEHLRGFLVYMHTYFRRQRIHYRIFVVEQVDSQHFNRAKLMNVGALAAMKAGFPCLVLHDVDLLPLRPANIYACTRCPRHMSSSINKFRFVLPYLTLFGGAIAIISKQYEIINGMSNIYFGWGGEDDDLYSRLQAHHLKICRFEPDTSRYHMLVHRSQPKLTLMVFAGAITLGMFVNQYIYRFSETRKKLLSYAKSRMMEDGLNSLHYVEVATVLHPLFTHIMVDL